MFRLHLDRAARETLVQQAAEQIVCALHLGQLRTGDRLPSVRSLSRTWGIDPKTAFRTYHALVREGFVVLRPGSGAYVAEVSPSPLDQSRALDLLRLVRRHVAAAEESGIDPFRYMDIIARYVRAWTLAGDRPDRLAVIECNVEQVGVFSEELGRRLQVGTLPLLLHGGVRLAERDLAAARACRYLVTTDFHFAQVEPLARRIGRRLLCVRLDPSFIRRLLALATRGTLGMIVTDTSFLPAFRRSIMALGLDRAAARRIEAASGSNPDQVRALIARADSLYVSPLCAANVARMVPRMVPVLRPPTHLSNESIESIEAMLLFGEGSEEDPLMTTQSPVVSVPPGGAEDSSLAGRGAPRRVPGAKLGRVAKASGPHPD